MVLIQGTTPTIIINIKNDIEFSQIAGASLTISQRDKIRVHKDITDITVNPVERRIKVLLTQEDTLNLREGDAIIQVRILMSDGTALASLEKEIGVIRTQGGEISSEEYTPEQWTVGPEPTIERIRLNLIPVGTMPICHASQFDKKRQIEIELYNGAQPYFLSDEVLELDIKKPDGNLVTMDVPYDVGSNSVIFETTEQACAVAGKCFCELRVTKGEKDLGSLNFYLEVEPSPSADGVPSGSEINNLHSQIEEIITEIIGENYYTKTQVEALIAAHKPYVEVEGILLAGETEITLEDESIVENSTIDIYTPDGTEWVSRTVTVGSITITFDEQEDDLPVKVRVS